MKKLLIIFIGALFFIACKSSSKQLESGNYDAALQKSAKKIKKNPGKFEEVDTFNDAYRLAYEKDNTEVNRLKEVGDPANWSKIYSIYLRMKKRQDLAASLPPVGINYTERNYSKDISIAKTNATEYAYDKGIELLATYNRFDARKAYGRFKEAKGYDGSFKDVNAKIAEAKLAGVTNIFFRIDDNAKVVAPKAMMDAIQNINVNDLDKGWRNYDSYIDTMKTYHYSIILNLKQIVVSPEQSKEKASVESKEIEDGFEYVLDANGNVVKDSLGNDVKTPKYKTITCQVLRYHQRKTARTSGLIEYYDNATDKLLKSDPVTSDAKFEHFYTIARGDLNALKPETQKELNIKPLPFPQSEPMIMQAGEILKKMTKDIIVRNQNFLK